MKRCRIEVPSLGREVKTAYVESCPGKHGSLSCEAYVFIFRHMFELYVLLKEPCTQGPAALQLVHVGTGEGLPVLLLHGFDGSCLEFRRLFPLLCRADVHVLAVDLVGWGFSCAGFAEAPDLQLGPEQKTEHLYAFWKHKVAPVN